MFIDEQEDSNSLKLIYTSTNTLVAEELFKKIKLLTTSNFSLEPLINQPITKLDQLVFTMFSKAITN